MKLCKIIVPEYQQFKDFELDLTYPKDHPKAGKPLEKVCFIGPNGTGKTTLLNIISLLTVGEQDGRLPIPTFSSMVCVEDVLLYKTVFYNHLSLSQEWLFSANPIEKQDFQRLSFSAEMQDKCQFITPSPAF